MIAFNYVEKFNELAELPPLTKLEVLEIAHGRALKCWASILSAVICVALAVMIGNLPKLFFQFSEGIEGTLLGIGILVGIGCFHWLYVRRLHENVKQLVAAKRS